VVVVLLAAGLARRFGSDKLVSLLPDGRMVGAASLATCQAAWPNVLCVVRPGTAMVQVAESAGVQPVECPEAIDGMGFSLAAGIRAASGAAGWVIALADMPYVSAGTIRQVALAVAAGARIIAPTWAGERGHPVGFNAAFGPELVALSGDEGARTVVARHRGQLSLLPVDDPGILRDIDRPADLAQ
jgi:molybdenum cofactor cytidylyltransferase